MIYTIILSTLLTFNALYGLYFYWRQYLKKNKKRLRKRFENSKEHEDTKEIIGMMMIESLAYMLFGLFCPILRSLKRRFLEAFSK